MPRGSASASATSRSTSGTEHSKSSLCDACDALKSRPDHGFLPQKKQVNLNAALRAEGLLETDAKGAIKGWDAYVGASFGVTMKRGAYLGWDTASVVTPLGSKGGHGYDASSPEMRSSLVMAGPDVPAAGEPLPLAVGTSGNSR
jgi:hypothetical protein